MSGKLIAVMIIVGLTLIAYGTIQLILLAR